MSPGTFNLTYELGEPGEACYDTDQQAITVYPAPYIVQVNMIQPGNQGVFHLVAEGQPGVTFEWFEGGELLTTGDTLYDYLEQELVLTATNTYGCATSQDILFFFPGVFDLREVVTTWLSPTTLEVLHGVERATLWDIQGRQLWSHAGGATRVDLPLKAGDGWRLITLELTGGGVARLAVIR